MKKIFENEYQSLFFDDVTSTLAQYWTEKTTFLLESTYQEEEIHFTKHLEENPPKNILINFKNFDVSITPDLQIWLVTEMFPIYEKNGVKKGALVASEQLFPQISILQTIEEHKFSNIDWVVFEKEEEAMNWIKGEK